ncbi:epiplakin [Amia ocellicauda]|uniref:epiplakin n=1 Tax=Amia ocellicauda TaxID=2972642 RepID=UPI003463B1D7
MQTERMALPQNTHQDFTGTVAGVFLEMSNEKITIYQAIKKRLLKQGTGLALLEAQAASDGIIDPINNKRFPVEEAVKAGLVGSEMKGKLLAAERALNGYQDPYTGQTLSLFQALQKDLIPKPYAVRLMEAQISTGGIIDPVEKFRVVIEDACTLGHFDEKIIADQGEENKVFFDPNSQDKLTFRQLLDKCTVDPDTGLLLLPIGVTLKGLRKGVSITELLASKIIGKELFEDLQQGTTTTEEVMLLETVNDYLEGTGSIAGIADLSSNKIMSIYQAMKEGLLMKGTALILLEAQAATGFIIDPVNNKKLTVDEALRNKLVGPEFHGKLLSAERAVTGYQDPYTGQKISLFQAIAKDLIIKDHGIRLLEAQISTGGIIDPIHSHRLPVDVAYQRGYFDKVMNEILADPNDDTKGFFDPNTNENLTYLQLMGRCFVDLATGLCLLPLKNQPGVDSKNFIDYETKMAFKEVKISVNCGKFMGKTVSLWKLLMSEYFSENQRQDMIRQYREGSLTIKTLTSIIPDFIEHSVKNAEIDFDGLREKVTAQQLLDAEVITKNDFEQLSQGKKTVKDVTEDETVKTYLQGTGCIAGVLLSDSGQIMTIYEARRKNKLMPGTSLILLEAQAATGFIIDPIMNTKYSVAEAVKAKIIGADVHGKLSSAEKAVTGYKDPYTGNTISLFQAMKKNLIVKDHGIRLLEAQIATGGIIDPVNSHRIPVHVAYKRGYFDEEMNQILNDTTDDTKGFFDPNTQENLTYLQLLERCVTDSSTGLCLLPLKAKSSKFSVNEQTKETFQAKTVNVKYGRFTGKNVTLWDVINSEYLCEEKRQELFRLYKNRKITIEQIITIIVTIIEQNAVQHQANLLFQGLRKKVSPWDLVKSQIIDKETYDGLINGKLKQEDVIQMDHVKTYLKGSDCVAGLVLTSTNETMSIYEAQKKCILTPGTALYLLEAQAATGFIIDPLQNKRLTVDEAVKAKLIGPELYEKLLCAEKAVTGYIDPYMGKHISLFEAMKKDLILKQHGIRLLEAQIATGGIIDPLKSCHLPLEVAYMQGYFDEEMNKTLSDPNDDNKGFLDPNTKENLTYLQIIKKCIKDPQTGLLLLPLSGKFETKQTTEITRTDKKIKEEFTKHTLNISAGNYSGRFVNLWELIQSGYFTEEEKSNLIEKYRSKRVTIEEIITTVTTTITKLERQDVSQQTVMGLKKPVSLVKLRNADIIDEKTFKELEEGQKLVQDVVEMDSVKQYLKGTGSVAGILVEPSKEIVSIYQASAKGLLMPGTALLLLEAQAATGFIIDPIRNRHFSVDDAIKEGLIGPELHEKLLQAEQAVTGYTDPCTEETISLSQAIKKEYIEKNHGIRLLEAQIATGGIIDPINSHRVPLNIAYRLGYFDEEINQVLSNSTDDTKGFFDPETKENITYSQLKEKCVKDSNTRLLLLPLLGNGSSSFRTDAETENTFKKQTVNFKSGKYKGKTLTVWEILFSKYITEEKRTQLVNQYKSRVLTMESIIEIITMIIEEINSKTEKFRGLRKQVSASELYESKIITKDMFNKIIEGNVSTDDITNNKSVQNYLQGTNCIEGVIIQSSKQKMSIYQAMRKGILTPGTALVLLEAQAATGFLIDPVKNKKLSVQEAVAEGLVGRELRGKLLSAERAVTGYTDPYTGNTISLFQALKKDLIVKDHGIRLLEAQIATGGIIDPVNSHRLPIEVAYQRGYFDKEMNQILSDPDDDTKGFFDPNTKENLTYLQLVERGVKDPETGHFLLNIVNKGEEYFYVDERSKGILKSTTTANAVGAFKGETVSLWEILYSDYITEERRRELLRQYTSGQLKLEPLTDILLTTIRQQTSTSKTITTITETTVTNTFHGIRKDVSAEELLKSKIIDQTVYEGLRQGTITVDSVSKKGSVQKYLQGTNSIAGVHIQSTKEKMSIYEAKRRGILTPGTALVLLEAQAATGFVIDPVTNRKLSVEEAVAEGLVGRELRDKLLSAERAVTGYTDPYTGNTISLFQALKKDLIVKDHGIRLLEAQIATGGIIDPVNSHRLPVEVAYQRGYFDQEMNQILSDPDDDTKGFFDPNTKENLTYLQLVERGVKDPETGLFLLNIVNKGEEYFYVDERSKGILKSTTTANAGGAFKGETVSLWEILYSDYITEEKRRELLRQYKSGQTTLEALTDILLTTIRQQTSTSKTITTITETTVTNTFHGIRKDVSAEELLKSKIIDQTVYEGLRQGTITVDSVSKKGSVQKYLQGTNSIAGVHIQSTKEKMSIYEAKRRGILTPGTALVLLEAQAATGFVIDPVTNRKLSVEEAVAEGLVGRELRDKLLSAERAVTGYTDPYTGNTISLFQALKKDLIVKDHGIRLLEAQIATGGIIDPVNSHRLPVEVAYQRGYFDQEMNQILSDPDDDTKGFFDPNTKENLTYLQLVERGVKDPETGLFLLNIVNKGEEYFYVDERSKGILKSTTTANAGGAFKGETVSLWEILYSDYITEEKRRELLRQYKSGQTTLEALTDILLTTIRQQTSTSKTITTITETTVTNTFHGIRKDVSAEELLKSKIIDQTVYEGLRQGTITVDSVSKKGSVQKYLQGTNSIAGVHIQSTKEKMSIYEAKRRGILTPGTALVLLEAQAATGFVIDPVTNRKLSVEEAVAEGLVGRELRDKLLSAERAVTGYTDPYTGNTISLFQALKKDLIVKDHGICLLEAQIATGGIIDPVNSHRLPVEVAYQRGYFDQEMNQILSDPDDDTKGFFDPNTKENLTYLQLVERGVKDPETGLFLLNIVNKGEEYFYVDERSKGILKSTTTANAGGAFKGETVSLWEILYSDYITEEKRRELLRQYKSGQTTLEALTDILLTTIRQQTSTSKTITTITETTVTNTFHGIRKDVSAEELLKSKIIDQTVYEGLRQGTITVDSVSKKGSVQKYLQGTNSIAGVHIQSTKEKMSIYEAKRRGILTPGTALVLLEAQAATGFVIDPVTNRKLSVEEAVAEGLVGRELRDKLLSAERAVTGYTDPYTGNTISLFQALKKDLIVKDHGIRLLEAQIATGGIIDPVNSHRLPVEVAYQRGYFDQEMNQILSDPDDDTKGFFDPNTKENLTYLQLVERGVKDPETGLFLLNIVNKGEEYFYVDERSKGILKSTTTANAGGAFKGETVSLWEILYSDYITEEKRRELLRQYKSGQTTLEALTDILLTTIRQQTSTSKTITTITETTVTNTFHGIRKDVSAEELLKSKIIDQTVYEGLRQGTITVDSVSKKGSVQKYLQGTNSIAGVHIQSTKEKMSIYEAKRRGILTPGTALVLLEAQAATGFVIDPVTNRKLSVEEAVAEGLVGRELRDKLLSAERAVTGYTDPYTGNTISLFQALKKDLIVKDHGIRLLEAQIATGGIIDPVNSHRLPVEVAYQRGYFDQEMNQILSDPDDDTKGFFDPNTKENLTYLQLVERGVKDPETGLFLLNIVNKGEEYFYVDERSKGILKSTTTANAGGAFKGETVSLWEILYSDYITEEKRRELLRQYKSGQTTLEALTDILLTTIRQQTSTSKTITTITETTVTNTFHGIRKDVSAEELLKSKIIDQTVYEGLRQGTITVDSVSKKGSVQKYLQGTNSIAGVHIQSTKEKMSIYEAKRRGILTPGTALVLLEAQAATGFVIDLVTNRKLSVEEAVAEGLVGRELRDKLLSAERAVTGYTDPYTGNTISLFQALKKDLIVKDHGIRLLEAQIATGGIIDPVNSHRLPVEVAYQRGYFDQEMNQILSDPDDDTKGFFDPNTKENLTYLQLVERGVKDPETGLFLLNIVNKGEEYFYVDERSKGILKSTTTANAGGAFKGETVSLWEILYSDYITEEKRRELLRQYKSGQTTLEALTDILLTTIRQQTSTSKTITTITETTVTNTFHGIRKDVSAEELLKSKIIDQTVYEGLRQGTITVDSVSKKGSVQKYLQGTNSIAGVHIQSTKEKMSIYEAKRRGILTPGTALVLLEAQAATGFVIDPVTNRKLSVEEAVAEGLVGRELRDKLLSAERAVTGYTDPYTGNTISLFQALKKDLIVKDHGIRLLEAQIATGGIIDPVNSHRLPVEVAYQRGYFDQEMNQILSDPDDDTKGFFDPNTKENLTYLQLVERGVKDPETGLFLLNIVNKGEEYFYVDKRSKGILKSTTTANAGGAFKGETVSLWEILYSDYITEEKRRELLRQYKSGQTTLEALTDILLTTIRQQTSTSKTITTITETTVTNTFHGIRKDVSAEELLKSKIIDQTVYEGLRQGTITVDSVSKKGSVQKYLQGTNSIAGVHIQSTKEKMSIYEAKRRGILTPGTALVLLEAQAATGFVIDPVTNRKLSVEEAVAEGLVGRELRDKLLSAERAVTGYTDPYTGNTISLFQALKKDLIVKDHGIRLLEAQIATGGIIDPVNSHRLPVEVAYQRGYFDQEMNQILSDPDDDTKGFFDPNTKENLTYLQLVERGVKDPETGLFLLNIVNKGEEYFYVDERSKGILKSTTTANAGGAFKGEMVSLWEILYSDYITEEKRRELLRQYKSGQTTLEALTDILLTTIRQQTSTSKTITTITETTVTNTFHGIRKDVSAEELLKSKIIDQTVYEGLRQGTITVDSVSKKGSVQKYLQGTNSIAGVHIQSTKEKMSIYEAKRRGILTPGTALVLLEAQAATGFVIDPVTNRKLSVEEAVAEGLVGRELRDKLLSAERAVTGYTDPYTGNTISLFQALKKDLIVKDHGIRLLEAQIATGGIIDPVNSHRLPVEVAYQRGYFDQEMNQILSDPDDDTKGFFDPNTKENLTYLQLVERGVKDPETGLFLLNIVNKGEEYFYVDERSKGILKSTTTANAGGAFKGETVSLWEILYSDYITEEKRRELLRQYKSGQTTLEALTDILLTTIRQQTSTSKTITTITETTVTNTFHGIRKDVSAEELLKSKIIDQTVYEGLRQGTITVDSVSKKGSVQKYLQGTNSIAGVHIQSTKEKMSIYEAKRRGILTPGTALVLLEAQAATGFVIDPVTNRKLSVEEAVAEGLVGRELRDKLLSAERAVTGYTDPYTGNTISLFQALKKDLIVKDHGIRLLEAQIATGGIIDPVNSHRLPVEVAYQRGYFDQEMNQILSDPDDDTKGFFDPNTKENLTYLQLVERGVKDPETGLFLLNIVNKGEEYFYVDERSKGILKSTTTANAGGAFKGETVSLWEILYSDYITEEKRRELLRQYKSGQTTLEALTDILLTTIRQQTSTSKTITTITETTVTNTFHGIRKDVSAEELLKSKIIDQTVYEGLRQGTITVDSVSKKGSVQKYLQGTNSIAGVHIQSTKEKMSIYEAKRRGILTPGTALVLLEAQAATGFVIDPVTNRKLSVEEAVADGLVGRELRDKLLSAERAVTGYTDPYTGNTISLFQALKKDLIVKDHGIRLLEAQIATGGIIDPVNSHRLPVEVAYQRGYFDQEMNQILSDPDDDTKGFFDPNTKENLTYLQLVERGVKDPETGLFLLNIVNKGEEYFYVDERSKGILKSTTTANAGGAFKGETVSLWEILYSDYITEEKRRELLRQYKSGQTTLEALTDILLTTIRQQTSTSKTITTITETTVTNTFHGIRKDVSAEELLKSKIIDQTVYEGLRQGTITVDSVSRKGSVQKYLQGTNSIAGVHIQSTKEKMSIYEAKRRGILTPGTALVLLEAQAATGFVIDPVTNRKLSVEEAVAEGLVGRELRDKLLSAERAVTGYTDPYTGNTISLFQALKKDLIVKDHGIRLLEAQIATGGIIDPVNSHRLPVEVAYQRGYFDQEMNQILSDPDDDTKGFFDPNTKENLTYLQLVERGVKDPETGLFLLNIVNKGEEYFYVDERSKGILKSTTTANAGGAFKGETVSLWEILYSDYITEEKRRELLRQYKSGQTTIEALTDILLTTIRQQTSTSKTITTITETTVTNTFHGIRKDVSAEELLKSKIIDQTVYEGLRQGTITVDSVSRKGSVQKYLQGTNSIAGVHIQSTKEKMSIYEAKRRGILTPGTALVLLEAQAATGFVIDPVTNRKLSVEEAVAEGLVGRELRDKLLSAERAVTGYTDPYTGNTISLFQALKKDLIVKDHGIRLLEAQIATGGIIDPVNSHRLPVEVAYQRGYFDQEMNQILSDPDDDTKGFFDPNTKENLTYLQLVERGVNDPETGLCLLSLYK